MSNLRMMPYECNPITGICEGGFGGGGPAGYSWAAGNVPYFAGYTQPETPILVYPDESLTGHALHESQVRYLYRALLNREPDTVGFNTYVSELDAGIKTIAQVEQNIRASDEFARRSAVATVTPASTTPVAQTPQQAAAAGQSVSLLLIGGGLLAIFLLSK